MNSVTQKPPYIWLMLASLAVTLASCEGRDGPGPEIHDKKYVGVSESGETLPPGAPGLCVLDQFTGLVWEVKSEDSGLRSRDNTYTWFDPDEDFSGELDYRGTANGGKCTGSPCDTTSYVSAINERGLCGYHDWRMPSRDELGSISDPRKTRTPPTINIEYFPNTRSDEYWSSNDYQFHWNTAWLWNFGNGLDRVEWKSSPRYVRVVRGDAKYLERVKD